MQEYIDDDNNESILVREHRERDFSNEDNKNLSFLTSFSD